MTSFGEAKLNEEGKSQGVIVRGCNKYRIVGKAKERAGQPTTFGRCQKTWFFVL
jgi:hypothetical protein